MGVDTLSSKTAPKVVCIFYVLNDVTCMCYVTEALCLSARSHQSACRHSGNQGTTGRPARAHKILQKISLRTRLSQPGEALQAWRGSSGLATLAKGKPSARDLSSRGHQAEGLGEASSLAGFPSSPSQLCLLDRAHMGSALSAESRTRQSAMTTALSLPF